MDNDRHQPIAIGHLSDSWFMILFFPLKYGDFFQLTNKRVIEPFALVGSWTALAILCILAANLCI